MDANELTAATVSSRTTATCFYRCGKCDARIMLEEAHAIKYDGWMFIHYCLGCVPPSPAQEVK